MRSIGTDISVMLVFSLLVAAPIWMARRWWFERLAQRRSHAPVPNTLLPSALPKQSQPRRDLRTPFGRRPHPAGTGAADPYRSLLLSRPFLLAASVLLLLSAAVLLLNSQYKQSTLRLEHGAFVLTRVDPVSSDTLFLDADALTPGAYRLEFEQTQDWGWYEWTLSQGTTQDSTFLSLAMGIVLASTLVTAGLLAISGMLALRRFL